MTEPRGVPRRLPGVLAAAALALGGLVGLTAPAGAVPVFPSQDQVDGAKAAATTTAGRVATLEGQLAAANARLETAQVAAQVANEDYNEAQVALQDATVAADEARQRADEAQAALASARRDVGVLAASAYRQGGSLGGLEAVLSDDGPQTLIDRAATLDYLGDGRRRVYETGESAQRVVSPPRRAGADRPEGAAERRRRG